MNAVIRIGTRESELALWQANFVKDQLDAMEYQTSLVLIRSDGDENPDQPLYELGITGIFTRSLDLALLRGEIDIAVHSLKDVPTVLAEGIIQAAVLKRGNFNDLLVYKNNEEFLAQEKAVIATGSLRRRAQWLNRYPTHTIVGLRGNVNTRLEKLRQNAWNGAIFAAAGLERTDQKPRESISLGWMLPAPGQGAVMIAALEKNDAARQACTHLNHEDSAICTGIEREFLHRLEGGCSAPIGALAYIKNNEISFKGILLNTEGTKKIEVAGTAPLGAHSNLARECAGKVLKRGGMRLMHEFRSAEQQHSNIYSTKKLSPRQLRLFPPSVHVSAEDFIKISPNRIPPGVYQASIENVVITSKNAVNALLTHAPAKTFRFKNIYCVGRKTRRLIERNIGTVRHMENSALHLAEHLVEYMEGTELTYFCSNIRMDTLPDVLSENGITVHEVVSYTTKYAAVEIDKNAEGILFFSPSSVQSFLLKNQPAPIAFCIGESTASEAALYFSEVRTAKIPTAEGLIDLVNSYYTQGVKVSNTTK